MATTSRRIRGLDAEQRRDQRRRQLLESALELFAGQGYQNTSIEQICQHVMIIAKGKLVYQGSMEQIRACGSLEELFLKEVGSDQVERQKLSWLET